MFWKKIKNTIWPEVFFLALLSGLVYLPWLGRLTYNKDDWYFLYDGLKIGAHAFREITLHTRPIRGPLYETYFSLFGLNPFPYHLVLYLTRFAGGIAALWLFRLLWPGQRFSNFILASLFTLYPGFLWWVSGFEFQPYVLSVTLDVFSIALTLRSLEEPSLLKRSVLIVAAIVLGWVYLALVEYAIGMELFRILCVFLFLEHQGGLASFRRTVGKTVRSSLVFLVIPIGFLIWYQFIFENWRKAQDAGVQLSTLFDSPANMLGVLLHLLESSLNVAIQALAVPFHEHALQGSLSQISIAIVFTALSVFVLFLADRYFGDVAAEDKESMDSPASTPWQLEAVVLGLIGTIGGVLPVILANRLATFDRYSHYTLPASLAGMVFIGGWLFLISSRPYRLAAISLVIGLAALTHHGLAVEALNQQEIIRDFWWQVTWRAPSIDTRALLVIVYPDVDYGDGDEVAWGPANFIYYPQKEQKIPVRVSLAAARMEPEAMKDVILGKRVVRKFDRIIKYVAITYDYRNVLLLAQASKNSCVRALDRRWPDVSANDSVFVLAGSKNSNIENIISEGGAPIPPAYVFATEPEHTWCYYFEKADLARQTANWEEIVRLDREAAKLSLAPRDPVEWMPFLQAYAVLGDVERVKEMAKPLKKEESYRQQSCQNLEAFAQQYVLQANMQAMLDQLFCQELPTP